MNRWGKTLADEPDLVRALRVHKNKAFDPTLTTTPVRAPCCGFVKAADAIRDLRGVPGTVVRAGNIYPPKDLEWGCDGCVSLLWRDPNNDWTESKLIEAEGAPIAIVHEMRAHEHVVEIIRNQFQKSEYEPQQIYDGALATLIIEHRRVAEIEADAA